MYTFHIFKGGKKLATGNASINCDGVQAINLERVLAEQYCRRSSIKFTFPYKCVHEYVPFAINALALNESSKLKFIEKERGEQDGKV